ncbi:MAG: cytochrome P450 [Streptomycetaceae bacterium]|nr:cytochrome P450 [Streptomycetaceae bacterium]
MATVVTGLPSLMNLYRPEHMRDPYALYATLRDAGPVHYDKAMRSWRVVGHADIRRLSRHPALTEDRVTPYHQSLPEERRDALAPLARILADMMLFHGPPEHDRLRAPLRKPFTPGVIAHRRARLREQAERLIDELPDGRVDFLADVGAPLTAATIADLLDIPASHRGLLDDWRSLLDEFFGQSTREIGRLHALRAVFDGMRGGQFGRECPMGALSGDDAGLNDDEAFAAFVLLIDAGQATTTHFLANALRALLDHPEQLELLRSQPELMPWAVHELMRYDSPVQFTARTARTDLDVHGHRIRSGDTVLLLVGAGNRDPRVYAEPDRLDLTRRARDHLSFGYGAHYCLGAPLALLTSEVVLDTLLRRRPALRAADEPPSWRPTINFRFLTGLPVHLGPR